MYVTQTRTSPPMGTTFQAKLKPNASIALVPSPMMLNHMASPAYATEENTVMMNFDQLLML